MHTVISEHPEAAVWPRSWLLQICLKIRITMDGSASAGMPDRLQLPGRLWPTVRADHFGVTSSEELWVMTYATGICNLSSSKLTEKKYFSLKVFQVT